MALNKVTYEKGKTVISAENLNDIQDSIIALENALNSSNAPVRLYTVGLLASAWTGADHLHYQVVTIDGVTPYSKVEPVLSVSQLAELYDKETTLVIENEDGVVKVYTIGEKLTSDININVKITEVVV